MVAELPVDASGWRDLTRELSRLAAVRSRRLLQLLEVGPDLDPDGGGVYLATESAPGGSVGDPTFPLDPASTVQAVAEAALGAHQMHEAGLAHGSINAGAILLTDRGAVLAPPVLGAPPGRITTLTDWREWPSWSRVSSGVTLRHVRRRMGPRRDLARLGRAGLFTPTSARSHRDRRPAGPVHPTRSGRTLPVWLAATLKAVFAADPRDRLDDASSLLGRQQRRAGGGSTGGPGGSTGGPGGSGGTSGTGVPGVMIERIEVVPGPGTVIRYGGIAAWVAPAASSALISFLAQSSRNLSPSARGGRQIADHIAGVLASRDPEPHVGFVVIGPSDHGWASLLHGPVQAWDGARWLAPAPSPGWIQAIITPRPAITVGPAGTPAPQAEPDAMWDLEAGVVPGAGFVLIPTPRSVARLPCVPMNESLRQGPSPACFRRPLPPASSRLWRTPILAMRRPWAEGAGPELEQPTRAQPG